MESLFVDECKQSPYLLVGFVISSVEQHAMRKSLRELLLPGQRSLHFKAENTRRKKLILSLLVRLKCRLVAVKCHSRRHGQARACALESLLDLSQIKGFRKLVLELDETVRRKDHQFFKLRGSFFEWDHRKRHEEPLLWVADAVAWCVNRGGDWERLVRPMIVETIDC
jgi:hypothetical protein